MAWWDHEELKSPKDRSDRYIITFPNEYPPSEVGAAHKRQSKIKEEGLKEQISNLEEENEKMKSMLGSVFPDKMPGRMFICGASSDKGSDHLPNRIMVCPAYGSDIITIYEKMEKTNGKDT